MKRVAAMVLNDLGQLLPYTCQSTMSACEEEAEKFFGSDVWQKLKSLGAKVVQVEITLIEPESR